MPSTLWRPGLRYMHHCTPSVRRCARLEVCHLQAKLVDLTEAMEVSLDIHCLSISS